MGEELELGNLFVVCDDGTYVPFEGITEININDIPSDADTVPGWNCLIFIRRMKIMTELEKMMAFHAMQEIKETPDWMQDFNLVAICKFDKTGKFEQFARILAKHKMPTNEIVPCVMELLQGALLGIKTEDKNESTSSD